AELKSPREVGLMREAGKLVAGALRMVRQMAKPGVRTIEIDRAVEDFFHSHNAVPLFKGYPGQKVPFPASTCLSVNEQVVHGIPRIMHENPQVPNYVNRDVKKHDFKLEEGLVLAIEPMVNMGRSDVDVLRDHWTVVTRDGLPSVHVEHTVAISEGKVVVITADEEPPNGSPAEVVSAVAAVSPQ